MANIKVSQMNEATAFEDGDYTMIVQANQNKKISKENILGGIEEDMSIINDDISTIENDISIINTDIQNIKDFLTLNNVENITTGTITGGGTLSGVNVTIEKNQDGSLAKIYGQLDVTTSGRSGNVIISSSLRPTTALTVNGMVYRSITNATYVRNNAIISMTIGTDGAITIPYVTAVGNGDACRLSIIACLLFIKDFDDNTSN